MFLSLSFLTSTPHLSKTEMLESTLAPRSFTQLPMKLLKKKTKKKNLYFVLLCFCFLSPLSLSPPSFSPLHSTGAFFSFITLYLIHWDKVSHWNPESFQIDKRPPCPGEPLSSHGMALPMGCHSPDFHVGSEYPNSSAQICTASTSLQAEPPTQPTGSYIKRKSSMFSILKELTF